ncbi:MAG: glycosyltransferase family 4 protein [Ginsengibacter sp.]
MQNKKKLVRITTTAEMLTNQLSGQSMFMQQRGFDVLMISSAEETEQPLMFKEGCRHIVIPMTRNITPFADIRSLISLVRVIKKFKPDIVHTESPKAGLLGTIAAWMCGVKVRIHTVAGLPLMVERGLKLRILKLVEKIGYGVATNVWPNGPSLSDYIVQNKYAKTSKLSTIGKGSSNGIDLQKFNLSTLDPQIFDEVKESIDYKEELTYLLFVGRMVYDKGVVELIDVFTALQKTNPNLRLILIGYHERNLDPLLPKTEHEIDCNNDIIHINWSDRVEYFMALSHYFVFASHREGFPNVLLEAGAMKLPIICSNIVGNIDIVQDGKTGILFEVNNENAFKQAVEKALQNPEKSFEMSDKLHKVITANFERNIFRKKMFDEYLKLLGEKKTESSNNIGSELNRIPRQINSV